MRGECNRGAVLRPQGSRIVARGRDLKLTQLLCDQEAVRLVAHDHGRAARALETPARSAASRVWAPVSASSCLGYNSRDSGHRRVRLRR